MPDQTKHIYRYQLFVADHVPIVLQRGSTILSVAPSRTSDMHIDLWATAYNPPGQPHVRDLYIVGTGGPIPALPLRFIGTCVMPNGLVWHVFEHDHD